MAKKNFGGNSSFNGKNGRPNDREKADQWPGNCQAPYNFVPVDPKVAVSDAPVFHDVFRSDDDYFTGNLYVELTALTPLAAMSKQSDLASSPMNTDFEKHFVHANAKFLEGQTVVDPEKKLLEPLMHDYDSLNGLGRVLLSGASMKGRLRAGIQALLSAPMERVQEGQFTFRPNLENADGCVPAVVHHVNRQEGRVVNYGLTRVDELTGEKNHPMNRIIYVDPDVENHLLDACRTALGIPQIRSLEEIPWALRKDGFAELSIRGVIAGPGRLKRNLEASPSAEWLLKNVLLLRHHSGADGHGSLQTTFEEQHPQEERTRAYRWVLVRLTSFPFKASLANPPIEQRLVVEEYLNTRRCMADAQIGHLRQHPLKNALDVQKYVTHLSDMSWPAEGDVVFLEIAPNGKIVGLGHHYRFRRKYRDSVHRSCDPKLAEGAQFGSERLKPELRNILRPLPAEKKKDEGSTTSYPQKLSGGRLLFGYVSLGNRKGQSAQYSPQKPNEPFTHDIGRGDGAQLAGRIAFNFAMEIPSSDENPRFLNEDKGCLVPLRVLGNPKPSAIEMYLKQSPVATKKDAGWLCTYGDHYDDNTAADLRGRKFYYHQPGAARQPSLYQLDPRDKVHWQEGQENKPHLLTLFSSVASHVLTPGSKLGTTIRITNLRYWELGALILAWECRLEDFHSLLKSLGESNSAREALEYLDRISQLEEKELTTPAFAIQLGHGKPLGLGSTQARIVASERFELKSGEISKSHEDVELIREISIEALANHLKKDLADKLPTWIEQVLVPWLKMHQFLGVPDSRDYPRDKQTNTIFDFHTNFRKEHSKARKRNTKTLEKGSLESRKPAGLEPLSNPPKNQS